jgi:hypothetical protein
MKMVRRSIAAAALAALLACAPARPPGETYLEYHKVTRDARSVEDLKPFLTEEDRGKVAKAPPKATEFFFGLRQDMEKMCVGAPKVVKEDVQGDKAVLDVEALIDYTSMSPNLGQKPAQAKVNLIKEKDGWKVTNAPNWQMK